MHQRRIRRLLVGAALSGVAITAAPSMASAASTCAVNLPGILTVNDGSGSQPLRIARSGQFVGIADGELGAMRFCTDFNGNFATVNNLGSIIVAGTTTTGGGGQILDFSNGAFAPGQVPEADGQSELEVTVSASAGGPLRIVGTSGSDTYKATKNGVMIGTDADLDVIASGGGGLRTIEGRGGNDFITGRGDFPVNKFGASTGPLHLLGGTGNDTLVDGLSLDHLFGDGNDDTLFSADGGATDRNFGGDGFDRATMDGADFDSDGLIEQITRTIGTLRLAPAVIDAKAGKLARTKLTWTHPRSWKQLKKIAVRVYDGAEVVERVIVKPRTAAHHGKTVTARLAVRLPKALAGKQLRLDVEATDRRGQRQLEPGAGLIRLVG